MPNTLSSTLTSTSTSTSHPNYHHHHHHVDLNLKRFMTRTILFLSFGFLILSSQISIASSTSTSSTTSSSSSSSRSSQHRTRSTSSNVKSHKQSSHHRSQSQSESHSSQRQRQRQHQRQYPHHRHSSASKSTPPKSRTRNQNHQATMTAASLTQSSSASSLSSSSSSSSSTKKPCTSQKSCLFFVWNLPSYIRYHACRRLVRDQIYEGIGGKKFVRIKPGSILESLYPCSQYGPDKCLICGTNFQTHLNHWWGTKMQKDKDTQKYKAFHDYIQDTFQRGTIPFTPTPTPAHSIEEPTTRTRKYKARPSLSSKRSLKEAPPPSSSSSQSLQSSQSCKCPPNSNSCYDNEDIESFDFLSQYYVPYLSPQGSRSNPNYNRNPTNDNGDNYSDNIAPPPPPFPPTKKTPTTTTPMNRTISKIGKIFVVLQWNHLKLLQSVDNHRLKKRQKRR